MIFAQKNGIQQKISLSFSALISLIIVVLLAVAYILSRNTVAAINSSYAEILLQQKNDRLTALVNEIDAFSKTIVSNDDIQQALQNTDNRSDANMASVYSEMSNIPTKIVAGVVVIGKNGSVYREIDREVGGSILADADGIQNTIAYSDGEVIFAGGSHTYLGGDWEYGETYLYFARKIRDLTTFGEIGYMVISVRESVLWKNLELPGEIGNYYVADMDGSIISAIDKSLLSMNIEDSLGIKVEWAGAQRINRGIVVNQIDNPYVNLQIVNIIPYSDLYANYYDILGIIVVIGLLAILLFAYMSFRIASRITQPLRELTSNMKEVADGNLNTQLILPKHTAVEITELNNMFSHMLEELELMMARIQEESVKEKDAELRALRAQINPHFLYNTLDTLYWMLVEKEEYDIANLVTNIGDLLRYAIRKGGQKVPLRDEITQIENYLLIEKNRYEEKLKYSIVIEPEAQDLEILSFTLQPIVENAINHGLMSKKGSGSLSIVARLDHGDLLISIQDDGSGIPVDLRDSLLSQDISHPDTGHIGMRNVDMRIKRLLGDRYGLEIDSLENVGTTVVVRFPIIKASSDNMRIEESE